MFFILISALIIFLFILYYFYPEQSKGKQIKHRAQVVCFYSNSCEHCKRLLDTGKWDKVVDFFKQYNYINVIKVEDRENPELLNKYGVDAVPTIKIIKDNGEVIPYEGDREPDAIIDFVKKNI